MEDGTVSLSRNVGGYRYTLRNIPEERISQNKSFYFLVTEKVQYVGCGNPHDHIVIPYTPVTSCIFCLHAFSCKILFKWAWNWKERTHIHSHVSKWGIQSRLIFQKICSQICWKLQVPGTYPCLVFTDRLCVRPSAWIRTAPSPSRSPMFWNGCQCQMIENRPEIAWFTCRANNQSLWRQSAALRLSASASFRWSWCPVIMQERLFL